MIAEAAEDEIRNLAQELEECMPQVDSICFLALFLDASAANATYPTKGLFFFRPSSETETRIQDLVNALPSFHLIRHTKFKAGLMSLAGEIHDPNTEYAFETDRAQGFPLEFSYLISDIVDVDEVPADASDSPTSAEGNHGSRVRRDLICEPHIIRENMRSTDGEKELQEEWTAWLDLLKKQRYGDAYGRAAASYYAFPLCVKEDDANTHGPLGSVILGLSSSKSNRVSLDVLCRVHHWCCYRQLTTLVAVTRARLYHLVLSHFQHEVGGVIAVLGEILTATQGQGNCNPGSGCARPPAEILQALGPIFSLWMPRDKEDGHLDWNGFIEEIWNTAVTTSWIKVAYKNRTVELFQHWANYQNFFVNALVIDAPGLTDQYIRFSDSARASLRRAIVASVKNSLEHTYKLGIQPAHIIVRVSQNEAQKQCYIDVVNPAPKTSNNLLQWKDTGTKQVTSYCLLPLRGKVTFFGIDENAADVSDAHTWFRLSMEIPLPELQGQS